MYISTHLNNNELNCIGWLKMVHETGTIQKNPVPGCGEAVETY